MSWWIYLRDPDPESYTILIVDEPHVEGGTYQVGGNDRAELSVTYNYSTILENALGFSFWDMEGKTAKETISIFEKALNRLDTNDSSDNYWEACESNVHKCISILLAWAKEAVKKNKDYYVWRVS